MCFEMRFDLGTLDSGERSLPFGLLVSNFKVFCLCLCLSVFMICFSGNDLVAQCKNFI